nr:hypothetical protein CFP56_41286 [Quercus suber]
MATEMLQQLDLAQSALRQNLLAKNIGDLLDRDALSAVCVGRGTYDAVRALAKLFGDSVALFDDKVLIEDLEDLAAGKARVGHEGRRGVVEEDEEIVEVVNTRSEERGVEFEECVG